MEQRGSELFWGREGSGGSMVRQGEVRRRKEGVKMDGKGREKQRRGKRQESQYLH